MFFSHTLLTSNMISSAIWCNKHLQIFQRLQIAFALQAKANLHQIALEIVLLPKQIFRSFFVFEITMFEDV